MRLLTTYGSYDEANDRQLDLLAAGIDARVDFTPAGHTSAMSPGSGAYSLFVEEMRFEEAAEIVSPGCDTGAESIAACPRCGSSAVREIEMSPAIDVPLLMLPSIVEFIRSRFSGTRYTCDSCRHTYRKSLTGR
jgi:predicted RNA-binding Zn-ribbon protein involved in translation (DUF1610 family)